MYTGPQNTELVRGVDLLRTIPDVEVRLVIISAGFGILDEHDLVPPYDCSFAGMKMAEVRKKSEELDLQASFTQLINNGFDFIYLALGKRYLAALGKDVLSMIKTPTVVFNGQESDHMIRIPCAAETVKSFSKRGYKIHGVVGFKGDLLRILTQYALEKPNPGNEVEKWVDTKSLKKLVYRIGGLKQSKE
jgi:hypothetical protein